MSPRWLPFMHTRDILVCNVRYVYLYIFISQCVRRREEGGRHFVRCDLPRILDRKKTGAIIRASDAQMRIALCEMEKAICRVRLNAASVLSKTSLISIGLSAFNARANGRVSRIRCKYNFLHNAREHQRITCL